MINKARKMSAKSAADALMAYDATLLEQVRKLFDGRQHIAVSPEEKAKLIREVAGTWTLSLAAAAGGVAEDQVLIALHRFHMFGGTQPAAASFVRAALDNSI